MTHNTRDGIEEILKQLDSLMRQAVEWQDTGAVYAYEKAKDVVRSVETTFHQELQKDREEERERILNIVKAEHSVSLGESAVAQEIIIKRIEAISDKL